jgi:hypothetical protein
MFFGLRSRSMVITAWVVGGAIGLAACATPPTSENAGAPPANYREIARDYLRSNLLDPHSARDVQIAQPRIGQVYVEGTFRHENGWAVCYRANAKNRMGGYTGLKEAVMLIRDNRVVVSNETAMHYDIRTNCAEAKYEPISLF